MDSILELQRQTHEEIERLQRALATVLSHTYPTQQAQLANQHKAAQILTRIASRVTDLSALYKDADARKAELDALSAAPAGSQPGQDDLVEFYHRLGKIREHHLKYPDSVVGGFEIELAGLVEEPFSGEFDDEDPFSVMFSGEEAYGRYLDLYSSHTAYNNLKHLRKRLPYLQYLDTLLAASHGPVHSELSKEARYTKEYESYLTSLHSYLLSFTARTQPLTDVGQCQMRAEAAFDDLWNTGKVPGWEDHNHANGASATNGSGGSIWCAACQRYYAKPSVYEAHLSSKKHIKAASRVDANDTQPTAPVETTTPASPTGGAAGLPQGTNSHQAKARRAAFLTHMVTVLLEPLSGTIVDTKANVERRFALTSREREQELLESAAPSTAPNAAGSAAAAAAPVLEDDQEEEKIYNPLKLPMGWDGKPIPYWLYKLHGLGVEYRCEICSDHVYMGRKNFDRHFQESRHAFGMRALGLPNTKHFHEITRIEDALALAEKLKQEGRQEVVNVETMEELEDDDGNVYNRKMYEDLKKQGIIR